MVVSIQRACPSVHCRELRFILDKNPVFLNHIRQKVVVLGNRGFFSMVHVICLLF